VASLRPVQGSAAEILALLRAWDAAPDGSPDAAPLVVETSGSTGEPKRVVLSRAAMRASADATHRRLGGPGQWLLALPPTYVAGLQVLFRSVRAGTEPVVADDVLEALGRMAGPRRYVSLVPTQLQRLLLDGSDVRGLGSFDAVLVGGASLEQSVRDELVALGTSVVTTYGMSETCGGCVYDGLPLDGVEVATGEDGRVRLRGPVLFDGYQERPELTAEVLRDGWFVTADLGRVEADGRLRVLSRVDDVVVSGGVNVPASAVAARLREHPDVRAAEVIGIEDDYWGNAVVAVVVTGLEREGLRDWVAEVHPRSWAPHRVVHVEELPLLPNGKVDRLAVQRLACR
jgi:O-succinylbenzoic acid--CoA ligase